MSGIEPGRPKIEEREAHLIWNGTRILLGSGVEWIVEGHETSERGPDYLLWLIIRRPGAESSDRMLFHDTDLIRCRVEEEDR